MPKGCYIKYKPANKSYFLNNLHRKSSFFKVKIVLRNPFLPLIAFGSLNSFLKELEQRELQKMKTARITFKNQFAWKYFSKKPILFNCKGLLSFAANFRFLKKFSDSRGNFHQISIQHKKFDGEWKEFWDLDKSTISLTADLWWLSNLLLKANTWTFLSIGLPGPKEKLFAIKA